MLTFNHIYYHIIHCIIPLQNTATKNMFLVSFFYSFFVIVLLNIAGNPLRWHLFYILCAHQTVQSCLNMKCSRHPVFPAYVQFLHLVSRGCEICVNREQQKHHRGPFVRVSKLIPANFKELILFHVTVILTTQHLNYWCISG